MIRRNFLKVTLPLSMAGGVRAAESKTPALSFGVIADPQYADQNPAGSRFYRNSLKKLEQAVDALNAESLAFVVTLGDVIDKDLQSFEAIMPLYDKLEAAYRVVPGNHDYSVSDGEKEKVLASLRMGEEYGSEVRSGWRFIYLDGTDVSLWKYPAADPRTAKAATMLERLGKEKLPQAKEWNAAIGDKQLEWLERELVSAGESGERVVVFNHYPVLPAGGPLNLWNAEELVALLEKHEHVAAYMNGHNHAGNYATHRGCHYVNFKGMVETEDKTAYAVVHCFKDRIEIEGSGLEVDRNLS